MDQTRPFRFDVHFDSEAAQDKVYKDCVQPLVAKVCSKIKILTRMLSLMSQLYLLFLLLLSDAFTQT